MPNKFREYQLYPVKYYSGSDARISFGGVPISDIVSIQYTLQEPIVPIYGYASYTYDCVARGARLVTGSFRINFVENFHIAEVMNTLQGRNIYNTSPVISIDEDTSKEDIMAWIEGQDLTNVQETANKMSSKIWGKTEDKINNYRDTFFVKNSNKDLTKYGFDVIINYGEELRQFTNFDGDNLPATVQVINGVHLTSVAQIIQPTGECIFEEYGFIAKDLNNTISGGK